MEAWRSGGKMGRNGGMKGKDGGRKKGGQAAWPMFERVGVEGGGGAE